MAYPTRSNRCTPRIRCRFICSSDYGRPRDRWEGCGTCGDRECTQACAAKGAQYVLVADGKVYKLTNHDAYLKTHAGHTVNLTGDVKGDTIRLSKIEMPKQ